MSSSQGASRNYENSVWGAEVRRVGGLTRSAVETMQRSLFFVLLGMGRPPFIFIFRSSWLPAGN